MTALSALRSRLLQDDFAFSETLAFVAEHYDYQPSAFRNGAVENAASTTAACWPRRRAATTATFAHCRPTAWKASPSSSNRSPEKPEAAAQKIAQLSANADRHHIAIALSCAP